MKEKLNTILESAKAKGSALKEKAAAGGQEAMAKMIGAMDKWLVEFPHIESYGLEVKNFMLNMSLSPSIEMELVGTCAAFPPTRLTEIMQENKPSSLTYMIMKAIHTTYQLHDKVTQYIEDPLIIKIRISLSPEISVFLGQPRIS